MEKYSSQHNESDLEQLITDYAEALKSLPSEFKLSSRQVLKILRLRDRIQNAVATISQLDDEYLAKLVDLDLELKQLFPEFQGQDLASHEEPARLEHRARDAIPFS